MLYDDMLFNIKVKFKNNPMEMCLKLYLEEQLRNVQ